MLNAYPADIWVLTETHDDLTPGSGFVGIHTAPRPKVGTRVRTGSRWVSIWSRYPLIETVECDGMSRERTVAARFQTPDRAILIYGTVLPWLGDGAKRNWSEFDRIAPMQVSEWRWLSETYPSDTLVVAGDWNQDMQTGRYYGTSARIALLREGLKSCGLSCRTNFDAIPKDLLEHPLIDHIAVPASYVSRVAAAWRPNKKELSDHGGVVVELTAL